MDAKQALRTAAAVVLQGFHQIVFVFDLMGKLKSARSSYPSFTFYLAVQLHRTEQHSIIRSVTTRRRDILLSCRYISPCRLTPLDTVDALPFSVGTPFNSDVSSDLIHRYEGRCKSTHTRLRQRILALAGTACYGHHPCNLPTDVVMANVYCVSTDPMYETSRGRPPPSEPPSSTRDQSIACSPKESLRHARATC